MNELIESWKARRAMLAIQLAQMEKGEMRSGTNARDILTEQDIQRLKAWIAELDALLDEQTSG